MSYRFTNTEKWSDSWFSGLKQVEMLLFVYLCDNCDIAGFIEVNYKRWSNDLSSSAETIQGACKGLRRGIIFSKDGDCLFIKNFLKHQKNLPLNRSNKAHLGILKRFELYSYKFDIEDVDLFIEGAYKGLPSPTGNGIGNGIDKEVFIKSENSQKFELFRIKYLGTKRGLEIEYSNFIKKNKPEVVELLLPGLEKEIEYRTQAKLLKSFVPEWKNLSTWINQKCWQQEFPEIQPKINGYSIQNQKSVIVPY